MSDFSYVTVEDVAPLVKGGLSTEQKEMLDIRLKTISSQLSGRLPGLRGSYIDAKKKVATGEIEFSDLVDLTEAMVIEAGRKFISNPDAMSSETIGVFAYSRFDSADPSKDPFSEADLSALRAMLNEKMAEQVGSIKLRTPDSGYVAAPTTTYGEYTNSLRRESWLR